MAPRVKHSDPPPIDPHDTSATIDRIRRQLETGVGPGAKVSRETARVILDFVDANEQTVSPMRQLTYLRNLPLIAERLGEDEFLNPTEETRDHFFRAWRGYQGWTITSTGAIYVKFAKWHCDKLHRPVPANLSIRVSKKNCATKSQKDVIPREDVAKIAGAATTARDRALISVLYESGTRAGELLTLRVGDVEPTPNGFRIHVNGKTGLRTIPLFEASVPALATWLNEHPLRDDKTAPLWCILQNGEHHQLGTAMAYPAAAKMIREAAKRAGVNRPVSLHLFRHSRATEVAANGMISTAIMEQYFGWSHGSPMSAVYVHLSGHEVEDAFARANGIEKLETPKPSADLPPKCPRCEQLNATRGRFCARCGLDLEHGVGVALPADQETRLKRLLASPALSRYVDDLLGKIEATARHKGLI